VGRQGDVGRQPQFLLRELLVDGERVGVVEPVSLLAVDAGVLRVPLLHGCPLGDVHE
jgi:hypothetical protein